MAEIQTKRAAPWFENAILTGLQSLLCLQLERTPAAEILPGTAMAWIDALWPTRLWLQDVHTKLIAQAFRKLAQTRHVWPSPAAFLDVLPAWKPTMAALKKLRSDDEQRRGMANIAEALKVIDGGRRTA